MSDDIDRAQEFEAQFLAGALEAQSLKPPIQAIGVCLYCNEALEPGRLFCGPECRDDYEHQERMAVINGGRP